jgi:hypothetical protein
MLLCPVPNCIEIAAFVDGVEVDERFWTLPGRLIPDLTKHPNVHGTHQLLAKDIEAVR